MSKRQFARLYINIKQEKWNVFIYKNPDILKKARQFPSHLYSQKAIRFTLCDFWWNFSSWHLYAKIMTLFVMWSFYIQKSQTLRKKQDNLGSVFFIEKSGHFALRGFSLNFWNSRRAVPILGGPLCDIVLRESPVTFKVYAG